MHSAKRPTVKQANITNSLSANICSVAHNTPTKTFGMFLCVVKISTAEFAACVRWFFAQQNVTTQVIIKYR